jgi:hypothetical protein
MITLRLMICQKLVIDASLTTTCDDESDPLLQDGIFLDFQNTILGVQNGNGSQLL